MGTQRTASPICPELSLHRAVYERAVVQHIDVLVAITVAAREMHVAGVAILRETTSARAAVVVSGAVVEDMGIVITRRAHLEAVAVTLRE